MSGLSPAERAIAAIADAQAEVYEDTIASLRAQLAEYGIRIKHLEVELAKSDDELSAQLAEKDKVIEGLREALTPSAETKAAYIGEFEFTTRTIDCDGDEITDAVYVPWTTVKEIMKAIRERALLNATPNTDGAQ